MKALVKYAIASFFLFTVFALTPAGAAPATWQQGIAGPAADSVYLVQEGDTYYSLSRRFSIPLDSLRKWNGLQLQIGQTLYLTRQPAAGVATAGPAPASASAGAGSLKAPEAGSSTTASEALAPTTAGFKTKPRVLVIPFDPYLYFSDADDEIARHSKIPRQNVRHAFRGRLDALLDPDGYESIHLLGGVYRDSVGELSKLYKSLNYSYQDNKQSKYNHQPPVKSEEKGSVLNWVKNQKTKLLDGAPGQVPVAQDPNKHFGVTVKDPDFFGYFNGRYGIDYYVFINQFEVKTNYENCLDRAAWNYERDFLVHYSIYDSNGELVAGNKVRVPYESNINDVQRIVSDNMPGMAQRVLADLPPGKN